MSSKIALWVIAVCLVLLVAGGGTYAFIQWRGHQHDQQVKAEREKYRDQAEYACTLTGLAPAGADASYLDSRQYKSCVGRQIDALVASDGESLSPY